MSLFRLFKILRKLSRWQEDDLRRLEKLIRAKKEGKPAPAPSPAEPVPVPSAPPMEVKEERVLLCIGPEAVFHSEARVENLRGDRGAITVGPHTHVRGELLLFPYGGTLRMGSHGYVGVNSRIWSGDQVVIGDNVLISHDVFITSTNGHELDARERALGYRRMLREGHSADKGSILTAPVTIGDDVWINPQSVILPGVSIGRGSVIGCGSVVTRSIPAGVLAAGNPARVIRELTPLPGG
ncbi:MAG: acyltransferase [Verrucomicrobiales bacterium]|nr:acyltransferase [Verrucomicrobiales bacterium]